MPHSSDSKSVEKLIEQFKGNACYWNEVGDKPGLFDRWTVRHFEVTSKITAARLLGEMQPMATEAVPVLIEALVHGPNDMDTGDGMLRYRSTIARALGKIGDARAIGPLIEKLKVKETPSLSPNHSGYASGVDWDLPTGCGHLAVVEALGRFGAPAKEAIPHLGALGLDTIENAPDDVRLLAAIETAMELIEQDD